MKLILASILAMAALGAQAQESVTVGAHLGTYHEGNLGCTNGENPGFYVSKDSLVGGTYYNSCERQTFYAGYISPEYKGLSLMVAGATGYADDIVIFATPTFRAPLPLLKDTSARITGGWLPVYGGVTVLHFSVERKF